MSERLCMCLPAQRIRWDTLFVISLSRGGLACKTDQYFQQGKWSDKWKWGGSKKKVRTSWNAVTTPKIKMCEINFRRRAFIIFAFWRHNESSNFSLWVEKISSTSTANLRSVEHQDTVSLFQKWCPKVANCWTLVKPRLFCECALQKMVSTIDHDRKRLNIRG